jgi:AbrB family looped-hinge helix DNA binding protein
MIKEVKISSKNQVTIPKEVMTRLGLAPSDRLVFQEEPGGSFLIRPKNKTLAALRGTFPHRNQKAVNLETMQSAIEQGRER